MSNFPDRTLENIAIAAGANVRCLWRQEGPKDTSIAWLECLMIGKGVVIVETFMGGGWQVFTASNEARADDTIAAVLNACAVPVPATN